MSSNDTVCSASWTTNAELIEKSARKAGMSAEWGIEISPGYGVDWLNDRAMAEDALDGIGGGAKIVYRLIGARGKEA